MIASDMDYYVALGSSLNSLDCLFSMHAKLRFSDPSRAFATVRKQGKFECTVGLS